MSDLSTIDLTELATRLVGACDLGLPERVAAIKAELARKQAMIDAAEGMAKAIAVHDAELVPLDVLVEYDAYTAAKGER